MPSNQPGNEHDRNKKKNNVSPKNIKSTQNTQKRDESIKININNKGLFNYFLECSKSFGSRIYQFFAYVGSCFGYFNKIKDKPIENLEQFEQKLKHFGFIINEVNGEKVLEFECPFDLFPKYSKKIAILFSEYKHQDQNISHIFDGLQDQLIIAAFNSASYGKNRCHNKFGGSDDGYLYIFLNNGKKIKLLALEDIKKHAFSKAHKSLVSLISKNIPNISPDIGKDINKLVNQHFAKIQNTPVYKLYFEGL